MLVTTVKCEMCDAQFPVNIHQRHYEWDIPSAWLSVFRGNPQHTEGHHFCSPHCLSQWLANLKSEVK